MSDLYEHVHMWRFREVLLAEGEGAFSEYDCELCDGLLLVAPGEPHPDEV